MRTIALSALAGGFLLALTASLDFIFNYDWLNQFLPEYGAALLHIVTLSLAVGAVLGALGGLGSRHGKTLAVFTWATTTLVVATALHWLQHQHSWVYAIDNHHPTTLQYLAALTTLFDWSIFQWLLFAAAFSAVGVLTGAYGGRPGLSILPAPR